jgi:arylsulfatase A-like enzyme
MKNVVLFTIDTLRRDALGLYGGAGGHTPFLDSLAPQSVVFTRAHSVAPYTQASFPGLLTSSYLFDAPRAQKLSRGRTMISEALREKGVTTAGFHSNPYLSAFFGWNRGWDTFYDSMEDDVDDYSPYIRGGAINAKVDAWLASHAKDGGGRPFFLWVHYMDVHEPYVPDRRHIDAVDPSIGLGRDEMLKLFTDVVLPRDVSSPQTVKLLHSLYLAHVREVDEHARELFGILGKHGLLPETSVIVTTDHGDEFGEHGGLSHDGKMYAELVHVPQIIVNPPEGRGTVSGVLVSGLDIPPTIMALLGFTPHTGFQGRPLFPLASYPEAGCFGEAVGKLSHKIKETDRPAYYCRQGDLKITYREENDRWELYDLSKDPEERHNIIDSSPKAGELKEKLRPRIGREPRWKE